MPLTGGPSRPFMAKGEEGAAWSPDGERMVFFRNGNGDPLFIADRTGGDAQPIQVDEPGFFGAGQHNHNPVWSTDGRWIYFVHGLQTSEMDIWRVRPSGGAVERMTHQPAALNFLAPIDARTVLYVGRAEDRSGPWLWVLDVERKTSRRVASGLEHYTSVSASRDGSRVVATVASSTAGLWRVPIGDRVATDSDVEPYALPTARAVAPRFGGGSLFYLSRRGAGDGLWRHRDGQAADISNDADGALSEPPAVSPDGRRVAVVVRQQGKWRLSLRSAEGTGPRTLPASFDVQTSGGQGTIDWSPDGSWIVAAGSDDRGPGLFKIPADGGDPVRLVTGPALNPVWSPDGKLIVYAGALRAGQVPLLGVTPEGTPVKLPELKARIGGGHRFLRDSSGLIFLPQNQSLDFWRVDFATGATRPITRLSSQGSLHTFDIKPDGKFLVFDRTREQSDIVLIDLPKS
jgi:Tol biopolymer transport system component